MYPHLVGKKCFVSPVSKRFVEHREKRRKAFPPFLKRKKKVNELEEKTKENQKNILGRK
jgi:hypothetical protein